MQSILNSISFALLGCYNLNKSASLKGLEANSLRLTLHFLKSCLCWNAKYFRVTRDKLHRVGYHLCDSYLVNNCKTRSEPRHILHSHKQPSTMPYLFLSLSTGKYRPTIQ